jgi:hypothetical protein
MKALHHRVVTYTELELAVVNTAETYVFMYPLFFRRPDQHRVRVLGKSREQLKRVAIQWDACI